MERRDHKLTVYLTGETVDRIDEHAQEVGATRAQVARRMLERSVERAVLPGTAVETR